MFVYLDPRTQISSQIYILAIHCQKLLTVFFLHKFVTKVINTKIVRFKFYVTIHYIYPEIIVYSV